MRLGVWRVNLPTNLGAEGQSAMPLPKTNIFPSRRDAHFLLEKPAVWLSGAVKLRYTAGWGDNYERKISAFFVIGGEPAR
jgi:hypothetical protein